MHKANLRIPYCVLQSRGQKRRKVFVEDRADSDCRRTIIQSFDKQRLRHYDFSIGRSLTGYFGTKRIDFSILRNQGPAVNQKQEVLNSPLASIARSPCPSSRTAFPFLFIHKERGDSQGFFTRIICIKLVPLRCDFAPAELPSAACIERGNTNWRLKEAMQVLAALPN